MVAAKETCVIRLLYKDPRGSVIPPLKTIASTIMSNQETDLTKQPIMEKINSPVFKTDDYFVISAKLTAADILVLSSSKFQIPVTIRNTRTGVVERTYLDINDFTEYIAGQTFAAGVEQNWCYHTIPAGTDMKLGHDYAFNSRLMISPYDDTG